MSDAENVQEASAGEERPQKPVIGIHKSHPVVRIVSKHCHFLRQWIEWMNESSSWMNGW